MIDEQYQSCINPRLLRGKKRKVLDRNAVNLLRQNPKLPKLANRRQIPKLVLGHGQRLAILLRARKTGQKNLLVNDQSVKMQRTSGRVHLDTLDRLTIVIEEPSVGIVDLVFGNGGRPVR